MGLNATPPQCVSVMSTFTLHDVFFIILVKLYETSLLDRESLKEPFTYITWCVANPGKLVIIRFTHYIICSYL